MHGFLRLRIQRKPLRFGNPEADHEHLRKRWTHVNFDSEIYLQSRRHCDLVHFIFDMNTLDVPMDPITTEKDSSARASLGLVNSLRSFGSLLFLLQAIEPFRNEL